MTRIFTDGAETKDLLFFDTGGGGGLVINTTLSHVRSGLASYSNGSGTCYKTLPSALSEFYFRGAFKVTEGSTNKRIAWVNSSTVLGGICLNTDFKMGAIVGSGSTPIASSTNLFQVNVYYLYEVYVKIADSGGRIVLKIDGNTEIDYTGDTKPGTATTVDKFQFYGLYSSYYMDDLALNDTNGSSDNSWTGDGRVVILLPNANGDNSGLTGSDGNSTDNYALVDEVPVSGTDYCQGTDGSNTYDLYNIASTGWSSGVVINRVQVLARALDTVANGGTCQLGIKPSGGSEVWSSNISLYMTDSDVRGTDHLIKPGGSAWSISDLENLQIGFKAT